MAAPRAHIAGAVFAGLLCAIATGVGAADWSNTEVQLLTGRGYELGDDERQIITLYHVSGWRWGSNFFFVDVSQPFAEGTSLYGEWYPRLSLGKITGRRVGWGPLKDVSVAASINAGDDFRAYLAGATLHFDVPGFSYLNLDLMAYDDHDHDGATYIVTPTWDRPFRIEVLAMCLLESVPRPVPEIRGTGSRRQASGGWISGPDYAASSLPPDPGAG